MSVNDRTESVMSSVRNIPPSRGCNKIMEKRERKLKSFFETPGFLGDITLFVSC